jgi:hypothetical protein
MEFFDEQVIGKGRDFIGESLQTDGTEDDRPILIAYHGDGGNGGGLYGRGRQVLRGP